MTQLDYMYLVDLLYKRQGGKCAYCGADLTKEAKAGRRWEVAHCVPRKRLRRAGVDEWHPDAVALVCTRKGHDCNDGMLLPIGLPRQDVIKRLKEAM